VLLRRFAPRWLGAVALAACAAAAPPPSMDHPLLGKALPEVQRPSLAGPRVDLASLRGKVVVVKFFAAYCEPCMRTLPEAQRVHERQSAEVAVVGVSEDERASEARELVARFGLTFPVVHDAGNVLSGRFRVREMPVVFVADRSGVVRWVGGPGQAPSDTERAVRAAR
jgi:peroxiredoxin